MKPKVLAVIPARMSSKRFSAKVLYQYRGKPLLFYVWKEVLGTADIDRLVIATDSSEIAEVAESFGAEVFPTSTRHQTGSDRVAQVMDSLGGEIIVNIQADNFGLKRTALGRVIRRMKDDRSIEVATLARRVETDEELFDPNLVKVIVSRDGLAHWFSRYPLPYLVGHDGRPRVTQHKYLGHIGVYFFRRSALMTFARSRRSSLEKAESLEQLRFLEEGTRVRVFTTRMHTVSVDSPSDVKKLACIYTN